MELSKGLKYDIYDCLEIAALNAAAWIGKNDKLSADKAATDALRAGLNSLDWRAKVEVSEYEKDRSYSLKFDEYIGNGWSDEELVKPELSYDYSIAVDPIECTTQLSKGGNGAMCVLAVSSPGSFLSSREHYATKFYVADDLYKLPEVYDLLHANDFNDASWANLVAISAKTLGRRPNVYVLNRARHYDIINKIIIGGANPVLIDDGDIDPILSGKADIYMGKGGFTESVLTAAGLKTFGGYFGIGVDDGDKYNHYLLDNIVKDDAVLMMVSITTGTTQGIQVNDNHVMVYGAILDSRDRVVENIARSIPIQE